MGQAFDLMLAYLDFSDPDVSTRSQSVLDARQAHWCAQTPYGLAVLRHREVGMLLRDRRLRQGSYGWPRRHGLEGHFTDFWEGSVISATGPRHQALRALIVPVLSDAFVAGFVAQFDQIAERLCDDLREREACEFMEDFSIPFAGQAIAVLLGLDPEEGARISHDASDLGLAMGVNCKAHGARINAACARLHDLAGDLVDRARTGGGQGGLIAQMVRRFDETEGLALEDLLNLIVITIFGGVDTTRSQLGLGMAQFMDHPSQWTLLRANRQLVPNAVEEMIRQRPTTTWVTREAVKRFEFKGQMIEQGTTLHMLVHASATDPAICAEPEFDVAAERRTHFGFGGGAHHCIGHLIARTDMACALRALLGTFGSVTYGGPPSWLPDSGNTSPVSLPIRYTRA